jgi:Type IV secretion-system coupling protein DNA-binding domain
VSLVHLSSAPLRIPKLRREEKKTKRAPAITVGHELILGENIHDGKRIPVTLGSEHRIRHTYVIGASGTGKSSLLLNMIIQDIRNGEGIGVLDPHGDLIDQILGHVPEERFDDVVLLDPSDEAYPVGFNILSAHSELEKNLLGSDLIAVFRRLSTSWGDQMGSVLANAILALLESERGGTLVDLRRFLVEADFRAEFLATVRDPEVAYYWQKEFPLLKGKPQAPILTRLDTFLRPKLIRYMVSQKENRLDFRKIMDDRKIFLAKLAQGAIGETNAYLLGALLVSKFHQTAMSRQEVSASKRPNFYLYIDEFQNFVTPSMASVLSGARKYHLGLILAHQELRQLWNRDSDVASAVISNPATRICFRMGDFDAKKLAAGFSCFEAEDLQNLGVGEAVCRVERSEYDFNLKTLPLPQADVAIARTRRDRLIALSREQYARRREEVEADLFRALAEAEIPASPIKEKTVELPKRESAWSPAVQTPRSVRPTPISNQPALQGRGGTQHKYLQQLIKRWAESKGYRAIIEKQILDGLGSVDVALEKDPTSIACEVSITSTPEQELGNIRKCISAGFTSIVLVSPEKKVLNKAKELISVELSEAEARQVQFLTPEELFGFIESLDAKAAGKEETVRGYKVKVQYQPLEESDKKVRKQAVSQVIFRALRRLKSGGGER